MAHLHHKSSRSPYENELWLSMSTSPRRHQAQDIGPEPSAYEATSNRTSVCPRTSRTPPRIPVISTSSDGDKSLPPSPSESERRRRKPGSLRGLLRREPSSRTSPTHLQPELYLEQGSSLSLDTNGPYGHNYSRSMPSSPFTYEDSSSPHIPATMSRARSSANYADTAQYQSYATHLYVPSTGPSLQQRSSSMNTYFNSATPSRSRTFPESSSSLNARENFSSRPRPHTWLSPTEPFSDVSQFHLFAEAMTGLPNESDPFSPTGPPQLQGSLFARGSRNDTIPIPLQYRQEPSAARSSRSYQRNDWQNFEPPPSVTLRSGTAPSSNLPRPESYQQWQPPPNMNGITRELQLLGLDDEHGSDDELPNYAQSQAEMNAKKRAEASARARELEARWRGTRGR